MWAVGDEGVILHHDGYEVSRFLSAATHPTPPAAAFALFDVWGTGPDNAWAVGTRGLILRWDGRTWTTFRRGFPGDGNLLAVFTASPNDAWFGASSTRCSACSTASSRVRVIPGLPSGVPVQDIHGTAASDIWAVAGGVSSGASVTLVSHFDGNAWSSAQSLPVRSSESTWRCGRCRPRTSGCGWGRC